MEKGSKAYVPESIGEDATAEQAKNYILLLNINFIEEIECEFYSMENPARTLVWLAKRAKWKPVEPPPQPEEIKEFITGCMPFYKQIDVAAHLAKNAVEGENMTFQPKELDEQVNKCEEEHREEHHSIIYRANQESENE